MKKFIAALLAVLMSFSLFGLTGCGREEAFPRARGEEDDREIQYIVLQLTNTHYLLAEGHLQSMLPLYDKNPPESNRMYAFGMMGPMLLNQSIEQMNEVVNTGFDLAERYDVPVYFQLDDYTSYTDLFGNEAAFHFWEDPQMCEWVAFPEEGEEYGGESNGRVPRFWYNWGEWRASFAFPNFMSDSFRALIQHNMREGFLRPLVKRYNKLIDEGKEYLFAGCASGWETHIQDNSNTFTVDSLPVNTLDGTKMEMWEAVQYGYAALHSLGYNAERLRNEARAHGMKERAYMQELLYGVLQNYMEFNSKTIYDAGIPRRKIFTHIVSLSSVEEATTAHPPIWTAVNPYSTPGFTMSVETCQYDVPNMLADINRKEPGLNEFACAEGYSAGYNDEALADAYFEELFGGDCRLVTVFGYTNPNGIFYFEKNRNNGFIKGINNWLSNRTAPDYDFANRVKG